MQFVGGLCTGACYGVPWSESLVSSEPSDLAPSFHSVEARGVLHAEGHGAALPIWFIWSDWGPGVGSGILHHPSTKSRKRQATARDSETPEIGVWDTNPSGTPNCAGSACHTAHAALNVEQLYATCSPSHASYQHHHPRVIAQAGLRSAAYSHHPHYARHWGQEIWVASGMGVGRGQGGNYVHGY